MAANEGRRQFLARAAATAAGAAAPLIGVATVAAGGNMGQDTGDRGGAITIAEQGSFGVGGTVLETDGNFDPTIYFSPTGNTLHGDHAYVQYQIPVGARPLPLVMWHGFGQHAKTWESTPDGREGYQTIFLRRRWPVYILDQPGRGRAGNRTEGTTINPTMPPQATDRSWWIIFRLGVWPEKFPGVQFPSDEQALDQYWRQMTPNTGPEAPTVAVAPVVELFDRIGPAVLITHSNSGEYGWRTSIGSDNVRAIVSYEPVRFVFPDNDPPAAIVPAGTDPVVQNVIAQPTLVSPAEFERLTRIPIQIVFGDYIPAEPSPYPGLDMWRVIDRRAEQFADAVNRRGGDVSILRLPDAGLRGNTHFPFSDLNNLEVADLLSSYLHSKGLDGPG